jgi:protein-disulfide isomerase
MDLDDDIPVPKEHKDVLKHTVHIPTHTPKTETITIKKDTFFYLIAIVMLVIGLSAGYVLGDKFGGIFKGGGAAAVPTQDNGTQAPERAQLTIDADEPVLGDATAPVTIVEFSDFQCPYCGKFATETEPQIIKDYVDTGKVKLIFMDFPLSFHENAKPAAIAAECATQQGKFWDFHTKLFENQQTLSADSYEAWAKELGLDMDKFDTCLTTNETETIVAKDLTDGLAAGVQGTPTLFIGNDKDGYIIVVGALPYEAFQQAIDSELSK